MYLMSVLLLHQVGIVGPLSISYQSGFKERFYKFAARRNGIIHYHKSTRENVQTLTEVTSNVCAWRREVQDHWCADECGEVHGTPPLGS